MTPARPLPTDAELQVLRVLWARGPSTPRDVHDALYAESDGAYTTALKLLQNLLGKGLVTRDETGRPHVYEAAVPEDETLHGVLRQLIDRSFEGSAAALAMHALGARRASSDELAELKALIERLEAAERSGGA
jgi:BlaI family transcriptional regulator, penicillinase repressor